MAVRQSKSRSTNSDRCNGEPGELYQRVIRRKLDLGRTGFAGGRHYDRCHRLQQQVFAGTRRPLARRVPPILRLLGHRAARRGAGGITKVRLLHLSMEIPRPRTKTPYIPPTQTGRVYEQETASSGACHVTISLIFRWRV
jgi:hypothetical protein